MIKKINKGSEEEFDENRKKNYKDRKVDLKKNFLVGKMVYK